MKLFGPNHERLSTTEKLDILSLTGGVPKYLEEVRAELSVDENYRRLCFLPRSLLFREFDETKRNRGCQIDLLIRTERMLMVVEIKRQNQIGHGIIAEVEEKVKRLRFDKRLSIRTALVYDGKLAASVPADRYFDFIVPANELL